MFSRRSFLRILGIAPVAAPAVIAEAAAGAAGGGIVGAAPLRLMGEATPLEILQPVVLPKYETIKIGFDLDTSRAISKLERVNHIARLAMRGAYRPPEASRAPKIELAGLSEYQSRIRRPARDISAKRK